MQQATNSERTSRERALVEIDLVLAAGAGLTSRRAHRQSRVIGKIVAGSDILPFALGRPVSNATRAEYEPRLAQWAYTILTKSKKNCRAQ